MDARSGWARTRLLGAPWQPCSSQGAPGPGRTSPSAESGVAANGSFRFLAEHDGLHLAWSRCRPITWKLNSGGVDDAVVEVVRDAVGRMAASSGFAFADRGFAEAVEGSSTDVRETLGVDAFVEVVPDDATDLLSGSEWTRTDVRRWTDGSGRRSSRFQPLPSVGSRSATGRCPGGRS